MRFISTSGLVDKCSNDKAHMHTTQQRIRSKASEFFSAMVRSKEYMRHPLEMLDIAWPLLYPESVGEGRVQKGVRQWIAITTTG